MTWQDWVEAGTRAGGRTEPSPEIQDGTSKRRRDTTVFFPSQSPPTFLPKAGKRILLFRPSVVVPLFNLPFPHFSRSQCKLEEFLKLIQQLENEECAAILFFVSAPSF